MSVPCIGRGSAIQSRLKTCTCCSRLKSQVLTVFQMRLLDPMSEITPVPFSVRFASTYARTTRVLTVTVFAACCSLLYTVFDTSQHPNPRHTCHDRPKVDKYDGPETLPSLLCRQRSPRLRYVPSLLPRILDTLVIKCSHVFKNSRRAATARNPESESSIEHENNCLVSTARWPQETRIRRCGKTSTMSACSSLSISDMDTARVPMYLSHIPSAQT